MKIEIVISWPRDPTMPMFATLMVLQIICTLTLWATKHGGTGIVVGVLVTLLSIGGFIGCFWKQEDLAYLSSSHAHRATYVLLLSLLGIVHTRGEWDKALYGSVYVINTIYIIASYLFAIKNHKR
jgi:hypothetical protein